MKESIIHCKNKKQLTFYSAPALFLILSVLLSGIVSFILLGQSYSQQLAFPTAEGFGKYTVGGRGGQVYEVTNLNDSGEGSLRAAVNAKGPRTVVFRVSGTINLKSALTIYRPYITIAGQTAPGDGICLRKYPIKIEADEVIIRYIRVRLGNESGQDDDAISSRYTKNVILDHVSASWSIDECVSLYHCEDITIQWCLISESLYDANHAKGHHGFGGIWGGPNATFHHNLIAHHSSRNPRFASGCGYTDFRNNVIYNWGYQSVYGGEKVQQNSSTFTYTGINMVANYYKQGPATKGGSTQYRIVRPSSRDYLADYGEWHVTDNYVTNYPEVTEDNWYRGVQPDNNTTTVKDSIKSDTPLPYVPIIQQTAEEAYKLVIDHVGATLPRRDPIDERIIHEAITGTATYGTGTYNQDQGFGTDTTGIIDTQDDVGGWPVLLSEDAMDDTDHDGMPDRWEDANGLDKDDPEDRNGIGENGYTNLEIYLNNMLVYPTFVEGEGQMISETFVLSQNYPNPFNPSTMIDFLCPKTSHVTLEIFDITGRKVATLIDEIREAGHHSVHFNGSNLGSGIYLYKLTTSQNTYVQKMILTK